MIRLAQLLCPLGHANIAVAFDPSYENWEEEKAAAENLFREGGPLRRRCGICGSTDLTWEIKDTQFQIIAEALPALQVLQFSQLRAREKLDLQGLTEDSKQHRSN